MGYCISNTPGTGDFRVEVRRESFYIANSEPSSFFVYNGGHERENGAVVEFDLKDIPKIRACLDAVERYQKGERK